MTWKPRPSPPLTRDVLRLRADRYTYTGEPLSDRQRATLDDWPASVGLTDPTPLWKARKESEAIDR